MERAPNRLRLALAAAAALILGVGTLGIWYFGTPTLQRITLVPGAEASFYVLRLRPQEPHLTVLFRRVFGSLRPELGHWDTEHLVKDGLLHLQPKDPGAEVIVEVRIASAAVLLEALPAQAGDMEHWERRLIPSNVRPDPLRISWPPNWSAVPSLTPPISKVVLKVVRVDVPLLNENVEVALRPPVTRVDVQPGYGIFQWFSLWPANLVVAGLCAMYVIKHIGRRPKNET